ncbi:MAG: DUF6178 family protein [Acidobacteriota bacterium]
MKKESLVTQSPEELIYQSVYAPVDLREMLSTADLRGRIRRLSIPHLFFGIKELEDKEIVKLLPHITETQWTGLLDLHLWSRDEMSTDAFVELERHLIQTEVPVANKLLRGTDTELWELLLKRSVHIYEKIDEDQYEVEPAEGEWLETPNKDYLITLPQDPEEARLLRALILRLYDLGAEYATNVIGSCRARTAIEIEECAFQNRKRRVEEMGFQDYFDAIDVYTSLSPDETLAEKKPELLREVSTLPTRLTEPLEDSLLLIEALTLVTEPQASQALVEELFFICNKVISADSTSPTDPTEIKTKILKTITGINLGLDFWASGNLQKAARGLEQFYLQSFFQIGYGRLTNLQEEARTALETSRPEPGSFPEAVLDQILEPYPRLAELDGDKVNVRFFQTRRDVDQARKFL